MLSKIQKFSFKKMHLKMLFEKWQLFCPSLNVLTDCAPGEPGAPATAVSVQHQSQNRQALMS